MNTRANLTERMLRLGMAWALRRDKYVSPDDPLEDQMRGRKTYHVHPDRSYPHQNHVKRFNSMADLEQYVELREQYAEAVQREDQGQMERLADELEEF